MKRISRAIPLLASVAILALAHGCGVIVLPNQVRVEVFNDTDFDVDPGIRFDADTGLLDQIFGLDELDTGTLRPGEVVSFLFDCDELGLIGSFGARQFIDDVEVEADDSEVLERERDFDCGQVIRFQFVGEGDTFGVLISVNGQVVD